MGIGNAYPFILNGILTSFALICLFSLHLCISKELDTEPDSKVSEQIDRFFF